MRILLTNDDGIDAPGIAALAEVASRFGECTVLAPRDHHSGCGHRATTHEPLQLSEVGPGRFMLDGTPVDCVRVALAHWGDAVDLVISGINEGGNLGCDVYYSGTVAAAREGAFLGTPSVAISQFRRQKQVDWEQAKRWSAVVLANLLEQPFKPGTVWNVNLPDGVDVAPGGQPELVYCEVDDHPLPVLYREEDGRLHYAGRYVDRVRTPGHDVDVCFSGRISLSEYHVHRARSVE